MLGLLEKPLWGGTDAFYWMSKLISVKKLLNFKVYGFGRISYNQKQRNWYFRYFHQLYEHLQFFSKLADIFTKWPDYNWDPIRHCKAVYILVIYCCHNYLPWHLFRFVQETMQQYVKLLVTKYGHNSDKIHIFSIFKTWFSFLF